MMPRWLEFLSLVVFAALSAGCGGGSQPSAAQPVRGFEHPCPPYDWKRESADVARIEFGDMSFDQPSLKARLLRWQNAAAMLPGENRHHEDWYRNPGVWFTPSSRNQPFGIAWWSTAPQFVTPDGRLEGSEPGMHFVKIETRAASDVLKPNMARITADWRPAEGWCVHFSGSNLGGDSDRVVLRFHPRQVKQGDVSFFPQLATWDLKMTHEKVNYGFSVALPELPIHNGEAEIDPDELRAWFAGAEAFRDKSLEKLDALERAARTEIPSGAATRTATVTEVSGGTHGGDPPMKFEIPADRALTDAERQQALDAALAEIALRRKLIEDNYADWYAAAMRAFPIDQFVPAQDTN